ncbi:MAG: alpha-glucosidase/alpha-galactosidase, partial [Firmicutes bacterium]|nr:alpha-glucosidase/alpha-galactosidase [Bacillota bacterium]
VDRNGIKPTYFGRLPTQLALLNATNMAFFDLAVEAFIQRDRDLALQALIVDPLTAAVCSLSEIKAMFDELYEAEKDYIVELR